MDGRQQKALQDRLMRGQKVPKIEKVEGDVGDRETRDQSRRELIRTLSPEEEGAPAQRHAHQQHRKEVHLAGAGERYKAGGEQEEKGDLEIAVHRVVERRQAHFGAGDSRRRVGDPFRCIRIPVHPYPSRRGRRADQRASVFEYMLTQSFPARLAP